MHSVRARGKGHKLNHGEVWIDTKIIMIMMMIIIIIVVTIIVVVVIIIVVVVVILFAKANTTEGSEKLCNLHPSIQNRLRQNPEQ